MDNDAHEIEILFVAGFGPITRDTPAAKALYRDTLGLPLEPFGDNKDYLMTQEGAVEGVKHFALWPLAQAAQSCFGSDDWPADLPVPQAWLEFDVADLGAASGHLTARGYRLLVANKEEPWGQHVSRFLSPEGLLVAVTKTPPMPKQ